MPSPATKEALCSASPTIAALMPQLEREIDHEIAVRRANAQAALGWRRRATASQRTHLAHSARENED